jgi:8-oxo-dGTP pyrophosphatase MutT (NUDIX family)
MPTPIKLASLVMQEESPSGEAYWGHKGAGVIIMARSQARFLFGLRSNDVNEPGTWGGFGGKIDGGETAQTAVKREVKEELGYHGPISLNLLYLYKDKDFKYYNYLGVIDEEFDPDLNWEHDNYAWVEFGQWPEPLHFGAEEAIEKSYSKIKQIFDVNYGTLEEAAMDAPPPPIVRHEPAPEKPSVATPKKLQDAYVVVATLWGEARGEGT